MESQLPFVVEGTVQTYLERRLGYRKESMKIAGYLAKTDFDAAVSRRNWFEQQDYKYVKVQDTEGYKVWQVSQRPKELRFYALQTPEGHIYLMSKMPAHTFKWQVLPFGWRLYPDLTRIYSTSDEIRNALTQLQKQIEQPLLYRSVVMKRLFGEKERFTDVHFSRHDRPFEDAFRTAATRGSWIDYIQVCDADRKHMIVSVSRKGIVSLRKGRFGAVYDSILAPMTARGRERYAFMGNRERHSKPHRQITPFVIHYDEALFDKPEVIGRLRNVLESYRHCYYTVVHSGNPYLYMMVMDTLDNSGFSVRTFGENALMVVPQVRTTADSLMRFYRFLSDEFREGTLRNPLNVTSP